MAAFSAQKKRKTLSHSLVLLLWLSTFSTFIYADEHVEQFTAIQDSEEWVEVTNPEHEPDLELVDPVPIDREEPQDTTYQDDDEWIEITTPEEEYELVNPTPKAPEESALQEIIQEEDRESSKQIDENEPRSEHQTEEQTEPQEDEEVFEYHDPNKRIIKEIIVEGNIHVPTEAILDRIPYRVGEPFDIRKTRIAILRLYTDLKRFRNINLYGEDVGDNELILYIDVLEKPVLKDIVYKGNTQVKKSEIEAISTLKDLPAIDPEEVAAYAQQIKKAYLEKGYFLTEVASHLDFDKDGNATAVFDITEKNRSLIKRINFTGNHNISGKQLRNTIYSREDWILGALDKSGHYMPDRVEMGDKQAIEQHYQNNGYLNAKVVDVATIIDPKTGHINLEFEVKEGDLYTVSQVTAPGNDILDEKYIEAILPIKPGDTYSREAMMNSIKLLERIWGDFGYIYAHVEPNIIPNDDEKTVAISFNSDIGNQVFLNKVTVRGNKKTRDKVIRRNIILEEGDLLTNSRMDSSKNRIEGLGYFEQHDGVNWKINRIDDTNADLELVLKEGKTGNAHLKLGFGGSPTSITSPLTGVTVEGNITDTNLFGSGIKLNLTGRLGKEEKTVVFNLTQPWLFDKPIFGSLDVFHKRLSYDELRFIMPVTQKDTGAIFTMGTMFAFRNPWWSDTFLRISGGVENLENERPIDTVSIPRFITNQLTRDLFKESYAKLMEIEFTPGLLGLLTTSVGQDKKNHPMHPSRGHTWLARSAFGLAAGNDCIGYHKLDFESNWYTPLIEEIDLVFRLHAYMGIISQLGSKIIPYRELYHIGGPASVRGFLYGEIGPQFRAVSEGEVNSASIGGRKTFFVNAELIFPITPDFSMKGLFFYDGGAGWANPNTACIPSQFLANNTFSYRHSIGAGVRILNPVPVRIDWGFKLDARKGETAHELHFGMTYDW